MEKAIFLVRILDKGFHRRVAVDAERRTYEINKLIDNFTLCFPSLFTQIQSEIIKESRKAGIEKKLSPAFLGSLKNACLYFFDCDSGDFKRMKCHKKRRNVLNVFCVSMMNNPS